jgi:transcriptional regulator with GAF, ATPase, and Fis domain
MKREMASMDSRHRFSHEIIGLGHKIVITSLHRNGRYNIPVFRKAGFHSLIAVPLMTYRIHGILGVAYRIRTKFSDDFTQLLVVIANLIGMSLNKSMLNKQIPHKKTQPEMDNPPALESGVENLDEPKAAVKTDKSLDTGHEDVSRTETYGGDFHENAYRMKLFNKSHK